MEEQIGRAANRLGSDFEFPAQCLKRKLSAVRKRFLKKSTGRGTPIYLLGDLAKTFRDLARAIAAMTAEDRPELSALRPLVSRLVHRLGDRMPLDKAYANLDADWPITVQDEMRRQLLDLEEEIEELSEKAADPDDADALKQASAAVDDMLGEVERPRPNWRNLRDNSRELNRVLSPWSRS